VDAGHLGLEYEADVRPKGRLRAHPIGALLPITAEQRRNPEHPKDQSDRLLAAPRFIVIVILDPRAKLRKGYDAV
jgi:hypothetical protein